MQKTNSNFQLKAKLKPSDIKNFLNSEKLDKAKEIIDEGKKSFAEDVFKDLKIAEEFFSDLKKGTANDETCYNLSTKILDIKSCSKMYDYPLGSEVARSLFLFLDKKEEFTKKDFRIIEVHLKTLRIIFKDKITDIGEMGNEIIRQLAQLNEAAQ